MHSGKGFSEGPCWRVREAGHPSSQLLRQAGGRAHSFSSIWRPWEPPASLAATSPLGPHCPRAQASHLTLSHPVLGFCDKSRLRINGSCWEGYKKSRNEGAGLKSQQLSLGWPLAVLCPDPAPAPRLPFLGRRDSRRRPRAAAGDTAGLAVGLLAEPFAGSGLYGDGKELLSSPHGSAALREGRPSFPALLRTHSTAPPVRRLPESHILLQEYGTILFSSFSPALTTWRLNCRLPAILPSQVKVTQKSTIHSTSQNACPFAGFMDHGWGHIPILGTCANF